MAIRRRKEGVESTPQAGDWDENKKDEPQPAAAGRVEKKEPVKKKQTG